MDISSTPPPLLGRTVAAQEWRDVTFVHWRVDPEVVRPLMPRGVRPDVFDGSSWVGLIAFQLAAARIGPLPPARRWGTFTEINVRLYGIDDEGRRGVVFASLEAASLPAVIGARALFSLPYMFARTDEHRLDGPGLRLRYASQRRTARPGGRGPNFDLTVDVDTSRTADDDLSTFLTARWGLFQTRFARTLWLPNTHEPWILHPARVLHLHDELCAAAGLPGIVDAPPESVLFSPGVDARFARGSTIPLRPARR